VILKTKEKQEVEKMKQFLESLTEDQRKHMLTTLEGVKLGMQLAKKHNVDLKQSFMVGDRGPDIEAGKKAQTKTVLVGSREKVAADYDFPHLLAFAKWLTGA